MYVCTVSMKWTTQLFFICCFHFLFINSASIIFCCCHVLLSFPHAWSSYGACCGYTAYDIHKIIITITIVSSWLRTYSTYEPNGAVGVVLFFRCCCHGDGFYHPSFLASWHSVYTAYVAHCSIYASGTLIIILFQKHCFCRFVVACDVHSYKWFVIENSNAFQSFVRTTMNS